jgi:hypothetical protein
MAHTAEETLEAVQVTLPAAHYVVQIHPDDDDDEWWVSDVYHNTFALAWYEADALSTRPYHP